MDARRYGECGRGLSIVARRAGRRWAVWPKETAGRVARRPRHRGKTCGSDSIPWLGPKPRTLPKQIGAGGRMRVCASSRPGGRSGVTVPQFRTAFVPKLGARTRTVEASGTPRPSPRGRRHGRRPRGRWPSGSMPERGTGPWRRPSSGGAAHSAGRPLRRRQMPSPARMNPMCCWACASPPSPCCQPTVPSPLASVPFRIDRVRA